MMLWGLGTTQPSSLRKTATLRNSDQSLDAVNILVPLGIGAGLVPSPPRLPGASYAFVGVRPIGF